MKMILALLFVVAATSAAKSSQTSESSDSITDSLKKFKEMMLEKIKASRDVDTKDRKQKALNYYSYYTRPMVNLDYANLGYFYPQTKDFGNGIFSEEWLSRTEPFKRKNQQQQLIDSPVYYIRLPPNPYVFVPGVGYVSRPPTLNDPDIMNSVENPPEKPAPQQDIVQSSFIQVPIDFISNAKPTGVYQLPNDPVKPRPDTSLLNLNKGPYLFNGKPTDIYILRNSYNSMYADALTHFYP